MAIVTQESTPKVPSKLPPFTGVNNATARLLKAISAFELASLSEGDIVYVQSVRDYWKWLPASVITSDDITYCAPTVVGAGAGRFERLNQASPDWMLQTTWVIDCANSTGTAHDENDGLTAATSLRTVYERQRRMGPDPNWNPNGLLTEYHLRWISDVPTTQFEVIRNTRTTTTIFGHSSMTNGQGQSTLFGPAAVGTVTALNYAAAGGGQPWEMICATIPVSWSTAGPAGSSLIDKRIRVTASAVPANVGGVFWPIKDLAGAAPNAKARLNEPQVAATFTAPFAFNNATFTPTAGDTFVVEKLTAIPNLELDILAPTSFVTDSLSLGEGGAIAARTAGRSSLIMHGSITQGWQNAYTGSTNWLGCQEIGTQHAFATSGSRSNSYLRVTSGSPLITCLTGGISFTRQMVQGAVIRFQSSVTVPGGGVSGGITINQLGIWDAPNNFALQVQGQIHLANAAVLWGNGSQASSTTQPAVYLEYNSSFAYGAGSAVIPASYFYLLTATTGAFAGSFFLLPALGVTNAVKAFAPAFDVGTNLFTADRLLSPANILATVAAGGFGGHMFDPSSRCAIGEL